MKDIRRVFEYHGREHKTVFAFESREPVTVEHAQSYETYHPRCGTSFLMTVMLISIPIYMLFPRMDSGKGCGANPDAAGDCRSVVRDHPICGKAPEFVVCADDQAWFVAPAHHNAASGRRSG